MYQTALITGASSGIGRELARCFAKDRVNLVLVARRRERLQELAGELSEAHNISVEIFDVDLSDAGAREGVYHALRKKNIAVDYLVNNAGFGDNGPFIECDWQKQNAMIELNITALSHLTRLFAPEMAQRGRGGVLNVASTAAFLPGPYMSVYYATKAYVLSFTEALAQELKGSGVRVSALCPGPVVTEFQQQANIKNTRMFSGPMVLDAGRVARIGYRGLMRGKTVNIAGLLMKLTIHPLRLTPRALVRAVSAALARNH